jgi:hypothetical protein
MFSTMAGQNGKLPLKDVQFTLDMGGYDYTGWFFVYNFAKYNIILGKSWMEKVNHHVDL